MFCKGSLWVVGVLFGVLWTGSYTQQVVPVPCVDLQVQQEFNVLGYFGGWYEIQVSPFIEELGASCVKANYSEGSDGSVTVYNIQNNALGLREEITGFAVLDDPTKQEGKLTVTFPSVGQSAPYWVLKTDYLNYAIVWACRPYGENSFQTLWFLSRTRDPDAAVRSYVKGYMEALNLLDHLVLRNTNQTDCTIE